MHLYNTGLNLLVSENAKALLLHYFSNYYTVLLGVGYRRPELLGVRRFIILLLLGLPPAPLLCYSRGPGRCSPEPVARYLVGGVIVGRWKDVWTPAPTFSLSPLPSPFHSWQRQRRGCGRWWCVPRWTRRLRRWCHRYAAQRWQRFFELVKPLVGHRMTPCWSRT